MTDMNPRKLLIDAADGIAEDLLDAAKRGAFEDQSDLDAWLWETVDGHECVIYTYKAKLLCVEADWGSIIETYGLSAAPITPEILAFYTLMEEVEGHPDYEEALDIIENREED